MSSFVSTMKRTFTGGERIFAVMLFGQLISFMGSGLTSFALGVWVFQKTGSITQYALISLSYLLPGIVLGPLMGALVDRWDRRRAMLISDLGAGISTLSIALVYMMGRLDIWYIYLAVFVSGAFSSLRMPSMTAAMTQLIPAKHFGRASGMMEIVQVGQFIIAPILAGGLMESIGLSGIILIDFTSFLFAISTLLFVRIPQPASTAEGLAGKGTLLQEVRYGWTYITKRPGLAVLMGLFAITNFTTEMTVVLFTPLILSFGSTSELGLAMSLSGCGFVAGGLIMSFWGGPKRRIKAIIMSLLFLGLFSALIGYRASVGMITISGFMATLWVPVVASSNQVIWQKKVAPDVQGRVFAIRRATVMATSLIAYVIAGPLTDRLFEPLMAVHGPLAENVGRIIGVGKGRGIGLLFISMGFLLIVVTAISCFSRHLRRVEDDLHDSLGAQ